MNINSKINWQSGMELTPEVFTSLENRLALRQQATYRIALGANRIGIIPGTPFNNKGVFVRNAFQIERFQCMAILPSGEVIHVDEPVSVQIASMSEGIYYLTVGIAQQSVEFESEDIPMVCPVYSYAIHTLEEVKADAGLLPIVSFIVEKGRLSIRTDYIVPCLSLNTDAYISASISRLKELVGRLGTHSNIEEGDAKRQFMRYQFMLGCYDMEATLYDYLRFTQEIAQAVDFYVMTPNGKHHDIPVPVIYDVSQWLGWLDSYLDEAAQILDTVEIKKEEIDLEKLKSEIKAELLEILNPDLYKRLVEELRETLPKELTESITQALKTYFNEQMKPELYNSISAELREQLRQDLYQPLYEALYAALYVPVTEDEYIPII